MAPRMVLVLAALAAVARAGVTVVSGDYAAVQAAVNAAADGDIILVKPGSGGAISGLTIDGKGLTLAVDGGSYVVGQLTVRNLPAGSQVVVRGLTVQGLLPFFFFDPVEPAAVAVRDCAGPVWLDACTVSAPPQQPGSFGFTPPAVSGLLVTASPQVVATDLLVAGGAGPDESGSCTIPGFAPAGPGGDGLRVRDARLALLRCTVVGGVGGGPGGACPQGTSAPGGPGARTQGAARLVAQGGALRGADDTAGAAGPGSGLVVQGVSTAALRGTVVAAGAGAPAAPDTLAPPGAIATWTAPPRGLQVTSPLRVGQPGTLTLHGAAGDLVAVFESPAAGWLELPGKQGVFALGAPLVGPVLALSLPADTLALSFSTPPLLPAGVQGLTVLLQALGSAGGQVTVDDVASCTLLDAGVP